MKTHDLLAEQESNLVEKLKQMKLKEMEKHAKKMLRQLGQADYELVLRTLIKAFPKLDPSSDRYLEVQNLIRQHTNMNDGDSTETIKKIAILMSMIIAKKFQAIHTPGTQH